MISSGRQARGLWGWVVALCIITVLFACSECYSKDPGKTLVWITIDTESTADWPIVQQLEAKADGIEFGIKGIMDICDRFKVKATFFLNVYEHKAYGEEAMQKIAQYIHSRGHDVQLHPHPDWAYDKKRPALWQYSLDEQIKIVWDGRELIKRWTGSYPIAFRAGGYMANNETMKAIQHNNMLIDSSFMYGNPSCRISNEYLGINRVARIDQLWEIPVTLYERQEVPNNNLLHLRPITRYRKIDIDWANYSDLESAITQAQKSGLKTITLFLHSFSFKKSGEASSGYSIAKNDIESFTRILSFISRNSKLRVVNSQELLMNLMDLKESNEANEFVPQVVGDVSYVKYLKRRYLPGALKGD